MDHLEIQQQPGAHWGERFVIAHTPLRSEALAAAGREDVAQRQLARSLILARPQGYARVYIDEGPPMALLLQETAADGQERAYARQLLGAISTAEAGQPPLVEPLSQRELEVLQLIAKGLTNREIADQLYLSLNTIKVHARNIYGKLGVKNRTQAVAKGKSMGILPRT